MRISVRSGPGSRVSMSLTGWFVFWLLASPFVAAWLALKLLIAIGKLIVWLVRRADAAPAVPPSLRSPPKR